MLLCVEIVVSVSPSCEKTAPNKLSSFVVSLHANALAIAVTDAVSSHGLILSPPYYNMRSGTLGAMLTTARFYIAAVVLFLRFWDRVINSIDVFSLSISACYENR